MMRTPEMTWDLFAMARLTRVLVVAAFFAGLVGAGMAASPREVEAKSTFGHAPLGQSGAAAARPPGLEIAQGYGLPPSDVGGSGAPVGSSSDVVVRVGQLEDQVRQLNGKIEELQFANRQLQDQLRKFQQDVEFRFQEISGKRGAKPLQKRSELPGLGTPETPVATAGSGPSKARDDAFDPAEDPNAPGAPRALGSGNDGTPPPAGGGVAADAGDANTGDAPINLLSSPLQSGSVAPAQPSAPPGPAVAGGTTPGLRSSAAPGIQAAVTTPNGTMIADPIKSPKEEYALALAYLKQKDYEDAEKSFAAYLAKNPKSWRASDALYYLGETYYMRGRQREAAEQYLKISTHYANSPRAPEAMLRLGEALHALGAKEQACATFNEVPRKYPNASAAVKAGAERAAKRAQC